MLARCGLDARELVEGAAEVSVEGVVGDRDTSPLSMLSEIERPNVPATKVIRLELRWRSRRRFPRLFGALLGFAFDDDVRAWNQIKPSC